MSVTSFTPGGKLYLCKGVGLDTSYSDTYHFNSITEQFNFFFGKKFYEVENLAPARPNQAIRIGVNSNFVYMADYMMFQNTNYNNKWWYAFITSIDWVNVNECQITYELDIIQTWYFDFIFPQMFIEREHVNNDNFGEHLIPENLETGEWIVQDVKNSNLFESTEYAAWATVDKTGASANGQQYGGIYSGLKKNVFTNATSLNSWIEFLVSTGKGDAIVAITQVPSGFSSEGSSLPETKSVTVDANVPPRLGANINGYIPRNNKLFTYPYNFIKVTNHMGNAGILKYEYFAHGTSAWSVTFIIAMDDTPNPTAAALPLNYKGYMGSLGDGDEQITINNFPQCAWASDTYKAWLAQNANTWAFQQESTVIQAKANILSNAISQNVVGTFNASLNGYLSIQNMLAQQEDKKILPPQAHGIQTGYLQTALGIADFHFCQMVITNEIARTIDDYFDMFGYAVHRLKVPNITGRQSWNYVKTQNASVLGNAPADACRKMEEILDSGVRFWHGDYIGQYFRSNGIVTTQTEEPQMIDLTGKALRSV